MKPGAILEEAGRIAERIGPLPLGQMFARGRRGQGIHRRRRTGSGSEFWQFRNLEPGEPASRIDWRRSARSDDMFVREREQEDPARLVLDLDGTGSMRFSSDPSLPTKVSRGAVILTALGLAARAADEMVVAGGTPLRRAEDLPMLLDRSEGAPPAAGTDSLLVMAGDFLDADWTIRLSEARRGGAAVLLLHVVDPAEAAFPFSGHVRFEPAEAEPVRELGRAEEVADAYHAAWRRHLDMVAAAAADEHAALVSHTTDRPADEAVAELAALIGDPEAQWAA
ncbi:hypothetical protein B5C34_12670 [Pacificimonas flava]|uniref:DUF58 domain-containing protein n=2 Tax=Pacificimonas TaxID=1960290 RepID=A0A219B7Y3_9SPHN|nr:MULTISPECIES: DUF58 domain-containing protein [Pacificimonas]MBZ6378480.1 DUF58 domain-containing protein [Pacificimonas aurantium]OWV34226.1 hypothetical protein B5C34_12670 [Pacificimonas flava]